MTDPILSDLRRIAQTYPTRGTQDAVIAAVDEIQRLLAEQRRVFELIYAPWAKHDFECVRSPEYCLLCRLRAALGEGA